MSGFFEAIYRLVRQVPPGTVVSYGQIALYLGRPRASRIVGCAMHAAPGDVPCHRVVGAGGSLVGYAGGVQRKLKLLELEGAETGRLFVPKKGTAL